MSDTSESIPKMSPATRSSLIIGGLFFTFIVLASSGVAWKAHEIRRERDETRALNNQSKSGAMVWIPEGKMTMGAVDGAPDEQPMRDVRLTGFYMDATEVTNEKFAAFVAETHYVTQAEKSPIPAGASVGWVFIISPNGSKWQQVPGANWRHPEGPDSDIHGKGHDPVVQVTWEDANAFAHWAGKRLPTEAEWEYAARGGAMHMPYVWGREFTPGGHWMANFWQGPIFSTAPPADGFAGRAPVGSYRANDFGLSDMAGNVWEWTADWYRADYYVKGPHKDPPGPDESQSLDPTDPGIHKRVVRGGSFLSSESNGAGYRPSARRKEVPAFASSDLGFRCARSVK